MFKSRAYSFPLKAKLFEAVVTPVALYGCAGWTLSSKMEDQLRTTRRRMLRIMLCTRRRPDESWIEFIKRGTAEAESRMMSSSYACWVPGYRRHKWRFVGKTVRATDERWSKRLLDWQPHFRCWPHRSVGHPHLRWEDAFTKIAGGEWLSIAASDTWTVLEHGFVSNVF